MRLGVLTGSGTHSLGGLSEHESHVERTRFGQVELTEGVLGGAHLVHISRHGERHERLSNHINHRANITAFAQRGVDAILAVTVCGAVDPELQPGTLVVFDDLYFLSNRLPDGSLCSLHDQAGAQGRGHWVFDRPFGEPLRAALLAGARTTGQPTRDGGCYGHVDGPRFNTRAEIRALGLAGVSAISQTAGPETVLSGEAGLPYALLGYVTDHANGSVDSPTPVEEMMRMLGASGNVLTATLAAAAEQLAQTTSIPSATGTSVTFD